MENYNSILDSSVGDVKVIAHPVPAKEFVDSIEPALRANLEGMAIQNLKEVLSFVAVLESGLDKIDVQSHCISQASTNPGADGWGGGAL
jgi:hypothetical protein